MKEVEETVNSVAGLSRGRLPSKGKRGGWVRRRRRKVYSGANAVNEEDPERDRATQV
jgi:hypothetical protein